MRQKKYPKLPNGYGSITKLSGKRRNPYMVRTPVESFDEDGKAIRTKPLCYTDTWHHAFAVLTAWHGGTYTPGMEREISVLGNDKIEERIISDYHRIKRRSENFISFKDVYDKTMERKFSVKNYSKETVTSYSSAVKHFSSLYKKNFLELRAIDYQRCIDESGLKMQMKNLMLTIVHQMYKYANFADITREDYSKGIMFAKTDVEHGTPFTDKEIRILKNNDSDEIAKLVLIMIYSGFRITEMATVDINIDDMYFKGGIKTKAGKGRIVPIHSGIKEYVEYYLDTYGGIPFDTDMKLRNRFRKLMSKLGFEHSPHDTRHTFRALCEHYEVRDADVKRMMGHSFGADITNSVYGHRTVEELRAQIEKICW